MTKTPWQIGWDEATTEQRKTSRRWATSNPPTWGCHLKGDRNQCPSCGDWFSSSHSFDSHRTGKIGKNRRCMTIPEMEAKGFARNLGYYWTTGNFTFVLPTEPIS